MNERDDEISAEADWEAEIDARVKDLDKGKVELVSADEAISRVRLKLAARRTGFSFAECGYPSLGA